MSKLSDTHNIQLTNLEILVLEYILEDIIDGFLRKLKNQSRDTLGRIKN